MKIILLTLCCIAVTSALKPLEATQAQLKSLLSSPSQLLRSFNNFQDVQGRHYKQRERSMRLRLFKKSIEDATSLNSKLDLTWTAGITMFSDMTGEEKRQYLGHNVTVGGYGEEEQEEVGIPMESSVDWRQKGAVSRVKNQGRCGSCWAFASTVVVEGWNKAVGGAADKLSLSDQEVLDCTYWFAGCAGGHMTDALKGVVKRGRLAPESAAKYRGNDLACNYSRVQNALQGKPRRYRTVSKSDSAHAAALNNGPIAVAFNCASNFQSYRSGIYNGPCGWAMAGHAIAMVGYDSQKFIIKNSWGTNWGMSGFGYFPRGKDMCSILSRQSVILTTEKQ